MNESEFRQSLIQTGKPVIVDFWAPWCAPCRRTKPILEKLANEYADSVEFIPINADDSRDLLQKFGILGIPTVLVYQNGVETSRMAGAQNEYNFSSLFAALAKGTNFKVSQAPFDRLLRLGAGMSLVIVGILTGNWMVLALGGVIAFLGVYDRCPIWATITRMMR